MMAKCGPKKPLPHAFKPGNPGGPGRPKGSVSGRKGIIQMMDKLLADPSVQQKVAEAMLAQLLGGDKKALTFLERHVYPNTPKESIIEVKDNTQGKNGVRILMNESGEPAATNEVAAGDPNKEEEHDGTSTPPGPADKA